MNQDQNEEYDEEFYDEVEQFLEIVNSVVDLVNAGELDKAEEISLQLMRDYPQQVQGMQSMALVLEARGENQKAAEYYRKTIEFMKTNEGFDQEAIDDTIAKAEDLEK